MVAKENCTECLEEETNLSQKDGGKKEHKGIKEEEGQKESLFFMR